jgi:RNA recognition motif-containing protein
MNIFVANINRAVTEGELKALFEPFGEVTSVRIINDESNVGPKGFGYVEMLNDDQALKAISRLTNSNFYGEKLIVSRARPKNDW